MTEEIANKIIELRIENIGTKTIAKMLTVSVDAVRRVCKKNNLDGYRARDLLTESEVKERIEERIPGYAYIGGWESVDKFVYLQCEWCGATFKTSAQFMKKHHWPAVKCKSCQANIKKVTRKEHEEEIRLYHEQQAVIKENRFWEQKFKQLKFAKCKNCGQLFIPGKRRMFCSDICGKYAAKKEKWKVHEQYRYLIPLELLYERDKGICHICGELCDFNDYTYKNGGLKVGDRYPSRDHVIPKSKGGKHTWDNIKLAHCKCNSLKGTKDLFYRCNPPIKK